MTTTYLMFYTQDALAPSWPLQMEFGKRKKKLPVDLYLFIYFTDNQQFYGYSNIPHSSEIFITITFGWFWMKMKDLRMTETQFAKMLVDTSCSCNSLHNGIIKHSHFAVPSLMCCATCARISARTYKQRAKQAFTKMSQKKGKYVCLHCNCIFKAVTIVTWMPPREFISDKLLNLYLRNIVSNSAKYAA